MTKLSVIVLIYNMEDLLPRCLASLERQTMKGIQFILVDDGSVDQSGRICDEWKPQNHSVKVIHKENGGVVAGWMDGVNAADGEYVGFVDSDDYIDDNMYETLWKAVETADVDVSMCNHLYESNGKLTPCKRMAGDGIYSDKRMDLIRYAVLPKLAESYLSPSLCNKIFRKELFKHNFQFCDRYVTIADDVSVVLPTLFAANSFAYVNDALYHYVTRDNSVTHTYRANMYDQHNKLLNNLERAIQYYQPNLPEGAFEMVICAMGNQWLRMITKAPLRKRERKKLLDMIYRDNRYIAAAKEIKKTPLNKWAAAYCDVVLARRYFKYWLMIHLLEIRKRLLKK